MLNTHFASRMMLAILMFVAKSSDGLVVRPITLRSTTNKNTRSIHGILSCKDNTRMTTTTKTTTLLLFSSSDHSMLLSDAAVWWKNSDVWVFVAGVIPFAWATIEFWSRIAAGKPFGTGTDSVIIGKDNAPLESRGRKTLDRGAFVIAYVLFGIAAAVIGITLYSVVTSPPPPPVS